MANKKPWTKEEILAAEAEAEAEALEAVAAEAAEAAAEAEALAVVAAKEEALQNQNAIIKARKNVGAELARRMKTIQANTAAAEEAATDVVQVTKNLALSKQPVKSNAPPDFLAELKQEVERRQANKATERTATDATTVVDAAKDVVQGTKKLALPTQNVIPIAPPELLAELKEKLNAMRVEATREAEFDKRMMMNANTRRSSESRSTTTTQGRIERSRQRFPDGVLYKTDEKKKGGIATRKKYRRRNKRKTKHYKKKAKCYTKKCNRRY